MVTQDNGGAPGAGHPGVVHIAWCMKECALWTITTARGNSMRFVGDALFLRAPAPIKWPFCIMKTPGGPPRLRD